MFNFSEVKENVGGGSGLYIYPGVNEVKILEWGSGETPSGDALLTLKVISVEADKEGNESAAKEFKNEFRLYGKAQPYAMSKVKHILTKVVKESELKEVSSVDELVSMLNALTKNKSLRMKFNGRQYEYNGELKEAATIGLPPFAEAINPGAEYEAVASADTQLIYNPDKDLEKVKVDNTTVDASTTAPTKVKW